MYFHAVHLKYVIIYHFIIMQIELKNDKYNDRLLSEILDELS